MRCSRFLVAAAAAVLAFAAPAQVASQAICPKYATALGASQLALMQTLITRVVFGVNNASTTIGVPGTFVALKTDNTLDVVSTANFGAVSGSITPTGITSGAQLLGVARRANNNLFYFIDSNGQLYSGDVDAAITSGTAVALTTVGSAVAARTASPSGSIGFDFNPVGDAIRITNGRNNFRVSPATGNAPGAGGSDGTDTGNTFSYDAATAPSGAADPVIVATAYTNQVLPSPRTAAETFGTTQYGIDKANKRFVTFNNSNAGIIGANFPITVNSQPIADFTSADLTVVAQAGGAGNVVVASFDNVAYTIAPATGVATALAGALNVPTPDVNGNSVPAYRSVAFTPARGNNGVIEPKNAVTGIAGSSNIVGFFNRQIIFRENQPDFTSGTALINLRDKLVAFFGKALGCNEANFPTPAANARHQWLVHQNMNITKAQFDTFNTQVATAATSFGVSNEDRDTVGAFLNTFNRQTVGNDNSEAICTQADCDCAPGFGPTGNCQNPTSSSSGGNSNGGSTAPSGGNGDNGSAAGLSAPFALVAALAVAVAALRA